LDKYKKKLQEPERKVKPEITKPEIIKPQSESRKREEKENVIQIDRTTKSREEILKQKMKDLYEEPFNIPERILFMALESTLYDEDKAINLINKMIEEDYFKKENNSSKKNKMKENVMKGPMISSQKPKQVLGVVNANGNIKKKDIPKKKKMMKESKNAKGPNPNLHLGVNRTVAIGPNPDNVGKGQILNAKGHDPSLSKGRNPDFWTGKQTELSNGPIMANGPSGLAKGSCYGFETCEE